VTAFGSKKLKLKASFDNGTMTKEQCSKLAEDLDSKLQVLAESDGLPIDTFLVRTKLDFKRTNRHQTVNICVSHFKSQNPNYGFLKDDGANRYGSDRKAQCDVDLKTLLSQSNNLGVQAFDGRGFDFRQSCSISSISLQKIL
jgi:hypothetical protein